MLLQNRKYQKTFELPNFAKMTFYLLVLTSIFSSLIFVTAQTTSSCSFPFTTSVFPSATPCGLPLTYTACASVPNSWTNCNPVKLGLYPALSTDPAYSVSENTLRAAIHIPSTYNNNLPAVILFPGTVFPTYDTYKDTIIAQLQRDGLNPVWINPPYQSTMYSTADAQLTAEYAAYAINYMNALNGKKNYAVGASQGSLNIQWALKYWTSTRSRLAGFVALSGMFYGLFFFNSLTDSRRFRW
jgi:hypothetical protein